MSEKNDFSVCTKQFCRMQLNIGIAGQMGFPGLPGRDGLRGQAGRPGEKGTKGEQGTKKGRIFNDFQLSTKLILKNLYICKINDEP